MKKSTLIARFLVNLKSGIDIDYAERIVLMTFQKEHPTKNFQAWNTELNTDWCEKVIQSETSPSFVNVERFILDLWDKR